MAMTRRVRPLVSLNPLSMDSWTIKVYVTSKGTMQTYSNFLGECCVFHLELTDQDVSTEHTHISLLCILF